jgi:hypothetical protein
MGKRKTSIGTTEALFNSVAENGDTSQIMEQYKIYVELMDRTSQRRMAANTFYISANATLLTVAMLFKDSFGQYIFLMSFVGIVLAAFWLFSIRSYEQLNTGKFRVINEIEKHLPLNLFAYEWDALAHGKKFRVYWPLSHIERVVPLVFMALYVSLNVIVVKGL